MDRVSLTLDMSSAFYLEVATAARRKGLEPAQWVSQVVKAALTASEVGVDFSDPTKLTRRQTYGK